MRMSDTTWNFGYKAQRMSVLEYIVGNLVTRGGGTCIFILFVTGKGFSIGMVA